MIIEQLEIVVSRKLLEWIGQNLKPDMLKGNWESDSQKFTSYTSKTNGATREANSCIPLAPPI